MRCAPVTDWPDSPMVYGDVGGWHSITRIHGSEVTGFSVIMLRLALQSSNQR